MIPGIDIIRSGHITRWALVRTHRKQTISEHMHQVAMFAHNFAEILTSNEEIISNVTLLALYHDMPEVIYGDIPTPTKGYIKNNFNNGKDIIDSMDVLYFNDRTGSPVVFEIEKYILKMADLFESICFLMVEGIGPLAKKVEDALKIRLTKHTSSFDFESYKITESHKQKLFDYMSKTLKDIEEGNR